MAVFPKMTIRRKASTLLQIEPLQVDQLRCSVPRSGFPDGRVDANPQWGVEYMKTYVYANISNNYFDKRNTRLLFDLFFESQNQEKILDFQFVYFKDNTPQEIELCTYEFKGWITQYIIIDPVMDLWRYVSPDWDPMRESRVGGFLPSIRNTSYMTVLRLELTGAVHGSNIEHLRVK
jgi:hypothetical protein